MNKDRRKFLFGTTSMSVSAFAFDARIAGKSQTGNFDNSLFESNGVSALLFIPQEFHSSIQNRTSSHDLTNYLQNWLDFCSQNHRKGYLPAGLYSISHPLFVTKHSGLGMSYPGGFGSNHIEGDGSGYTDLISQTTIVAKHTDGPALIIENGRGVRIAHIQITGQMNTVPNFPTTDSTYYESSGCRTNRYSPYAGIVVDATVRAIAMEDRYPKLRDYYANLSGGSKNITFENLSIRHFVAGIVISAASNAQGEQTVIRNCAVGACQYGISFGQSQSRGSVIRDCDIEYCQFGITTRSHGIRTGAVQLIDGCQFVQVAIGAWIHEQWNGCTISNCYFESTLQIVDHAQGYSQIKAPLNILSCDFHLSRDSNGFYEPYIVSSGSPVYISGSFFADSGLHAKCVNFASRFSTCVYHFENCTFWGDWPTSDEACIAQEISGPLVSPEPAEFDFCTYISANHNPDHKRHQINKNRNMNNIVVDIVAGFDGITVMDDRMYFKCLNSTETSKIYVGQILFWVLSKGYSLPALVVTDVVGDDVTAQLLFHPDKYDFETDQYAGRPIMALARNPRDDL